MKFRTIPLLLALVLLLTGCSWMDGSYVYVVPHQEQSSTGPTGTVSARDYPELMGVMEELVLSGTETCVINVAEYKQNRVENNMDTVCRYIQEMFPVGAYAVESISYEVGMSSGQPAIAVTIQYRRSRMEIQQIRRKRNMQAAAETICEALEDHVSRVVVQVELYAPTDFNALVTEYARENPQTIMEIPQISEGVYGAGSGRVIELNFTYQNSREALRQMQNQVRPVFESAVLYVSGQGSEYQKYFQLSSFLTERFDYQLETSITPSYSLLCHGVGDSRAFAEVYASMCRRVGLECMIVTGTRAGEPWTWNIICDGGNYFHVDLLRSRQEGGFRIYTDGEMGGYVWDYSAYPVCEIILQEPETTGPETSEPETSEPETEPQPEPEEATPEETDALTEPTDPHGQ